MLKKSLLMVLFLTSCSFMNSGEEKIILKKVDINSVKGWEGDNHVEAFGAFTRSCAMLATQRDSEVAGKDRLLAPLSIWKEVCRKAMTVQALDETSTRKFFEDEFVAFRLSSNKTSHALLTGYYEPVLNGARSWGRPYIYPVYKAPAFPVTASREEIDHGALQDSVPAIAYVDDPVQLFFMHVQGSGSIQIAGSNEVLHVGYAGSNKKPYTSIGKVLIDNGTLQKKEVTMQLLKQWLYDHPQEMWQTLWQNPSYIFFQELNGGPYGAQKALLTPLRSLAVDKNYLPLGMPVFVDTVVPGTTVETPLIIIRKLMVAQDTGSAIRTVMRGDIYFGSGYAAGEIAGRMNNGGDMTVLLPNALARQNKDNVLLSLFGSMFDN